MEQKRFDDAIQQCEEAVQVGRSNRAPYADVAKAYVRMGKAQLKKDDLAAALTAFRQAQVEHFAKDVERTIKQVGVLGRDLIMRNGLACLCTCFLL